MRIIERNKMEAQKRAQAARQAKSMKRQKNVKNMFNVSAMLVPPRLNNDSNMDMMVKDKQVYMQIIEAKNSADKT